MSEPFAGPATHAELPRTRQPRCGPENDLVERFLDQKALLNVRRQRVSFFREPKLLSGFPDLVAVRWDEPTAARWHESRAALVEDELRLLHFLTQVGACAETDLQRWSFSRVGAALGRLAASGLVHRHRGRWRAAPLTTTFAVRSIFAFEAKISNWAVAIGQAAVNRWFASESYVLVPRHVALEGLVGAARNVGVGVWLEGARRPVLRAVRSDVRQPVSYASWLFNEWSWRQSLRDSRWGPADDRDHA